LESVSRVRDSVIDNEQLQAAMNFLRLEAAYRNAEDLIAVGAYKPGSDPDVDLALKIREPMLRLLRQAPDERSALGEVRSALGAIDRQARAAQGRES
jgi:flagellar biosynthesis/type III secretory pathway ATPase